MDEETMLRCTFGDGKCRWPLWPQNIKTDAAIAVDIWVIDSCGKCNLRKIEKNEQVRQENDALLKWQEYSK